MGANNVEKLQEKLIDLSASAYKVNDTTGEIETNFIAQQRLKSQLDALGKGGDYEKFITLGKEAAKQKKILNEITKSNLSELYEGEGKLFSEEQQGLIASLSEIGKDGKISLNIPGQDATLSFNHSFLDC
jgi:predicted XRE-type DNA-binding protein